MKKLLRTYVITFYDDTYRVAPHDMYQRFNNRDPPFMKLDLLRMTNRTVCVRSAKSHLQA